MRILGNGRWVIILLVVLAVSGLWCWRNSHGWLAWYRAQSLAASSEEQERKALLQQLDSMGAHGTQALVECLHDNDEQRCERAGQALLALSQGWKAKHPLQEDLCQRLEDHFNRLSPTGRPVALKVLEGVVDVHAEELPSETVVQAIKDVISHGDGIILGTELRPHLLHYVLHTRHLIPPTAREWHDVCQLLVKTGLKDERPSCRVDAVRMAATPGVDMLDKVLPLIQDETKDPATEVRVVAVIVLGSSDQEELLGTDELLPMLHDPEPQVRQVTEQALRGRGLQGSQLHLARLVSHPEAANRAQAATAVFRFPELDAVLWLDRLSRDADPAVRASALRAASQHGEERFTRRVKEMANQDPSPTVRQIAGYYARTSGQER